MSKETANPVSEEEYDGWLVVLNVEDQYSIWDSYKPVPGGWRAEGFKGTKKACLDHIDTVWTDMRPKSLKDEMAKWPKEELFQGINWEFAREIEEARKNNPNPGVDQFSAPRPPNDLVKRLMVEQPVEMIRYRNRDDDTPDLLQLKQAVDLGLILVKFTQTQGGTELGANLCDNDGSLNRDNIDWNDDQATLTLAGRLKLDYTPVKLTATLDLKTFKGTGKLEVIDDFKIERK